MTQDDPDDLRSAVKFRSFCGRTTNKLETFRRRSGQKQQGSSKLLIGRSVRPLGSGSFGPVPEDPKANETPSSPPILQRHAQILNNTPDIPSRSSKGSSAWDVCCSRNYDNQKFSEGKNCCADPHLTQQPTKSVAVCHIDQADNNQYFNDHSFHSSAYRANGYEDHGARCYPEDFSSKPPTTRCSFLAKNNNCNGNKSCSSAVSPYESLPGATAEQRHCTTFNPVSVRSSSKAAHQSAECHVSSAHQSAECHVSSTCGSPCLSSDEPHNNRVYAPFSEAECYSVDRYRVEETIGKVRFSHSVAGCNEKATCGDSSDSQFVVREVVEDSDGGYHVDKHSYNNDFNCIEACGDYGEVASLPARVLYRGGSASACGVNETGKISGSGPFWMSGTFFPLYTDTALTSGDFRLTELLHKHSHSTHNQLDLYVSASMCGSQPCWNGSMPLGEEESEAPDFCSLQANLPAGRHDCTRMILFIENTTIFRFSMSSTPETSKHGVLFITLPHALSNEIREFCDATECVFPSKEGKTNTLRVRAKFDPMTQKAEGWDMYETFWSPTSDDWPCKKVDFHAGTNDFFGQMKQKIRPHVTKVDVAVHFHHISPFKNKRYLIVYLSRICVSSSIEFPLERFARNFNFGCSLPCGCALDCCAHDYDNGGESRYCCECDSLCHECRSWQLNNASPQPMCLPSSVPGTSDMATTANCCTGTVHSAAFGAADSRGVFAIVASGSALSGEGTIHTGDDKSATAATSVRIENDNVCPTSQTTENGPSLPVTQQLMSVFFADETCPMHQFVDEGCSECNRVQSPFQSTFLSPRTDPILPSTCTRNNDGSIGSATSSHLKHTIPAENGNPLTVSPSSIAAGIQIWEDGGTYYFDNPVMTLPNFQQQHNYSSMYHDNNYYQLHPANSSIASTPQLSSTAGPTPVLSESNQNTAAVPNYVGICSPYNTHSNCDSPPQSSDTFTNSFHPLPQSSEILSQSLRPRALWGVKALCAGDLVELRFHGKRNSAVALNGTSGCDKQSEDFRDGTFGRSDNCLRLETDMNCHSCSSLGTQWNNRRYGEPIIGPKMTNDYISPELDDLDSTRSNSGEWNATKISRANDCKSGLFNCSENNRIVGEVLKVYVDWASENTVADVRLISQAGKAQSGDCEEHPILSGVNLGGLQLLHTSAWTAIDKMETANNNNPMLSQIDQQRRNVQQHACAVSGPPPTRRPHASSFSSTIPTLARTAFSLSLPSNGAICFFWDTEATGLNTASDDITQIGCVCRLMHNGNWSEMPDEGLSTFSIHVATDQQIPNEVLKLTGVTKQYLDTHGVSLAYALESWELWCRKVIEAWGDTGRVVWFVAHNGSIFDLPLLLWQEERRCGSAKGTFLRKVGVDGIVDTVILSRRLKRPNGGRTSHKLHDLYQSATGFPMESQHDALGDCKALAEIMKCEPFVSAWRSGKMAWSLDQFFEFSGLLPTGNGKSPLHTSVVKMSIDSSSSSCCSGSSCLHNCVGSLCSTTVCPRKGMSQLTSDACMQITCNSQEGLTNHSEDEKLWYRNEEIATTD